MTNKKGTPRFNTKKLKKKYYLVMHPEYGTMIENNGWLSKIEGQIDFEKITDFKEYREEMRIKGDPGVGRNGADKDRGECERCGKNKLLSMFVDGLCAVCYRETESIETEIAQMYHSWKWGSESPNNVGNNGANWG